MRVDMKRILVAAALLAPAQVAAQQVAVLPVVYKVAGTGGESPEAAQVIKDGAVKGVQDAAMEIVDEARLERALRAIAPDRTAGCSDKTCLGRVADELKADEAIRVAVTENGEMDYEIDIVLARGEGVSEVKNDGLYVVASEVRRLVALLVRKSVEARAKDEPKNEPAAEPDKPWRTSPLAFWVGVAATGALAVGTGITEAVVYSRYMKLDNGEEDSSYWETTHSAQIAERVLFGCTLAGAVATGVLFFLTDFDGDVENPRSDATLSLASAVGPDGGTLMITGRF